MKTYRIGFLAALIGNVVLGVVLAGLWLHYRAVKPMADSETKMANSTAEDSMADSMATPPASTEAPLVPVQISPQRLQSIGVKTGKVERKSVADEIRTTGSVAVDERRLAYVQVRFSGYIQKVFADATYQYVRKGQPVFTVWVQAQVFQNDLERIKIGAPATLTVNTYPGRTFTGRVDFIYPQVDMDTRTAIVRVVFSNPGLQLKPGMFVNVSLKVPMGNQLVIPASGVLQSGTRAIAFVERSDGYIEPREVQLGSRVGDDLIVLKGLKAGEQIVTSANFLIDSESQLQAALGSFVPPPPGAGAASTTNAPQGIVELSSDPTTPRKGSNVFRVKLTDASGAPISGAEVSVTFFMPAMPAMGMASMRTPVTLSDKGNGLYEGSGRLETGGTWQVTILAKKNGQLIASKQLSVNATGGM